MPVKKLEVHNGKVTVEQLKQLSCEFDLESVHSIDLSRKELNDLSGLEFCTGLQRLNLSNNKLCRLQWIQDLTLLVHLDLSINDLSNLEPLRNLECLKFLNVSGNAISTFDAILSLKHLSDLSQLYFKEGIELSNPLCQKSGYPDYVLEILPQLHFLDGEKVRGEGAKFFYMVNNLLKEDLLHVSSRGEKKADFGCQIMKEYLPECNSTFLLLLFQHIGKAVFFFSNFYLVEKKITFFSPQD